MKRILVSGNVNLETNLAVGSFPVYYAPVRYAQFEINTNVGGVAYNVAKALSTLNDEVSLTAMLGNDAEGERIRATLNQDNINTSMVKNNLKASPVSIVMRDDRGYRSIYTDTKDLQFSRFDFSDIDISQFDMVVACNVNFNRELIHKARAANVPIATDVHVLDNPYDTYNEEFMQCADILFLSDEKIFQKKRMFFETLKRTYPCKIIVMGCGKTGAMMYLRETDKVYHMAALENTCVVNSLGAGDALFSSFVHFITNGYNPFEALKRAQIFASRKISFNGASVGFMSAEELERVAQEINLKITEFR